MGKSVRGAPSVCVPQDDFHVYDPEGATCRCGGEARAPIAVVMVEVHVSPYERASGLGRN